MLVCTLPMQLLCFVVCCIQLASSGYTPLPQEVSLKGLMAQLTLDHLLVQKDFGALCSLQSCSVVLQVKPRMVMAIKNRIAHQIKT